MLSPLTLVATAVSFAILAVLYAKIGVRADRVSAVWSDADHGRVALAFVVSGAWHIFLGADKWFRILTGLGAPVRWTEILTVRMGSDPVRFACPFKTGELVNVAYLCARKHLDFGGASSSILFDKVLNFVGTLFWLAIGLVVLGSLPHLWQLPLMAAVGAAFLALFVVEPLRAAVVAVGGRIHPKVRRVSEGLVTPFRSFSPAQKALFLLYGIVFQLRPLLVCLLLFTAFGVEPALREILAYGSVVVLMSNVPLTMAGIGPREAALALLFAAYGSQEVLLSVGVLMSFSIHIVPAIVGIPLMPRLLREAGGALRGFLERGRPSVAPAAELPAQHGGDAE